MTGRDGIAGRVPPPMERMSGESNLDTLTRALLMKKFVAQSAGIAGILCVASWPFCRRDLRLDPAGRGRVGAIPRPAGPGKNRRSLRVRRRRPPRSQDEASFTGPSSSSASPITPRHPGTAARSRTRKELRKGPSPPKAAGPNPSPSGSSEEGGRWTVVGVRYGGVELETARPRLSAGPRRSWSGWWPEHCWALTGRSGPGTSRPFTASSRTCGRRRPAPNRLQKDLSGVHRQEHRHRPHQGRQASGSRPRRR